MTNTTGGTPGSAGINEVGPNVAIGTLALSSNLTGGGNVAVGFQAAGSLTGAIGFTTAVGFKALASATDNIGGAAFGYKALTLATGEFNTGLGDGAGATVTTGSNSIIIGSAPGGRGENITTADNVISIGLPAANTSNSCFIGNIFGASVSAATDVPVIIDTTGKLGTTTSSQRFKKDIKPMDQASQAILSLKPVTFHYKSDNTSTASIWLDCRGSSQDKSRPGGA